MGKADCIVIVTDHSGFDYRALVEKAPLIVDTRNALKGMVSWHAALLMALGAVAGGYYGASAARLVGRTSIRRVVILIGFAIGGVMLYRLWH